ncbi:MAG: hypothetical protein LUE87_01300 [Lachnospiraceae bacterium]|nr:hypothetical protein [Lachnospiraceae bacterium]
MELNHKYPAPDEDIVDKLLRSRREVEEMSERELRCPVCNYLIAGVYGDKSGHIRIKCRKCKFDGVLNLAYFRRMKRYHREYTDKK